MNCSKNQTSAQLVLVSNRGFSCQKVCSVCEQLLQVYCQRVSGHKKRSLGRTKGFGDITAVCTLTCSENRSGDSGAAGEAAMVPAEPAPHEQRGGGGVPDLLLGENPADTSGPETAQHVQTHTHTHWLHVVCMGVNIYMFSCVLQAQGGRSSEVPQSGSEA